MFSHQPNIRHVGWLSQMVTSTANGKLQWNLFSLIQHMWHPHSGLSAVPFGVSHFKDARVSVHQDSLGEPILYAEVP